MQRRLSAISLVVIGLLLTSAPAVLAFPPVPSSFYGTVKVDGENVPDGTIASTWINGVKYAEATVSLYAGNTIYDLNVPGDDPATPDIEGGVEGDTVVFYIGGLVADQTGTWHSGTNVELNLTAGAPALTSITIVKETNPDGGTGFDFSGDLGNFGLDDDDGQTFTDLSAGDYDVTEAVPTGWDLDSVVCTGGDSDPISNGVRIHLDSGEAIICTFTNVQQPGSITIVKETDPDGGTGFDFSGNLGNFGLDDDDSQTFTDLSAGDYDVTEAVPTGWDLDSVVCTGGDSDPISNGVRVHLDPNEAILCTFTNNEGGGPPPLPSSFYGTVKVDGANVPADTLISAWIGSVKHAEATVSLYAGDTMYGLNVPGDDPATPGTIEGGVEGDTVVFHIGGLVADQTGIWHSGTNVSLDLTYSSAVPPESLIYLPLILNNHVALANVQVDTARATPHTGRCQNWRQNLR
jgi:hypothetical protein